MMRTRTCAAFLFDGFADHQLSLAVACLNQGGDYNLETFTAKGKPVTAASGLRVVPHASLTFMSPGDFDVLLLPGGLQWERGDNLEVFPLLRACARRRPLVAMGEAILVLADLGLLDHIPHTGKGPGYFERFCPDYAGASYFRSQPVVVAGNILTVNETAFSMPGHGILRLNEKLLEAACPQPSDNEGCERGPHR